MPYGSCGSCPAALSTVASRCPGQVPVCSLSGATQSSVRWQISPGNWLMNNSVTGSLGSSFPKIDGNATKYYRGFDATAIDDSYEREGLAGMTVWVLLTNLLQWLWLNSSVSYLSCNNAVVGWGWPWVTVVGMADTAADTPDNLSVARIIVAGVIDILISLWWSESYMAES